jgi:hypothetical protein
MLRVPSEHRRWKKMQMDPQGTSSASSSSQRCQRSCSPNPPAKGVSPIFVRSNVAICIVVFSNLKVRWQLLVQGSANSISGRLGSDRADKAQARNKIRLTVFISDGAGS